MGHCVVARNDFRQRSSGESLPISAGGHALRTPSPPVANGCFAAGRLPQSTSRCWPALIAGWRSERLLCWSAPAHWSALAGTLVNSCRNPQGQADSAVSSGHLAGIHGPHLSCAAAPGGAGAKTAALLTRRRCSGVLKDDPGERHSVPGGPGRSGASGHTTTPWPNSPASTLPARGAPRRQREPLR